MLLAALSIAAPQRASAGDGSTHRQARAAVHPGKSAPLAQRSRRSRILALLHSGLGDKLLSRSSAQPIDQTRLLTLSREVLPPDVPPAFVSRRLARELRQLLVEHGVLVPGHRRGAYHVAHDARAALESLKHLLWNQVDRTPQPGVPYFGPRIAEEEMRASVPLEHARQAERGGRQSQLARRGRDARILALLTHSAATGHARLAALPAPTSTALLEAAREQLPAHYPLDFFSAGTARRLHQLLIERGVIVETKQEDRSRRSDFVDPGQVTGQLDALADELRSTVPGDEQIEWMEQAPYTVRGRAMELVAHPAIPLILRHVAMSSEELQLENWLDGTETAADGWSAQDLALLADLRHEAAGVSRGVVRAMRGQLAHRLRDAADQQLLSFNKGSGAPMKVKRELAELEPAQLVAQLRPRGALRPVPPVPPRGSLLPGIIARLTSGIALIRGLPPGAQARLFALAPPAALWRTGRRSENKGDEPFPKTVDGQGLAAQIGLENRRRRGDHIWQVSGASHDDPLQTTQSSTVNKLASGVWAQFELFRPSGSKRAKGSSWLNTVAHNDFEQPERLRKWWFNAGNVRVTPAFEPFGVRGSGSHVKLLGTLAIPEGAEVRVVNLQTGMAVDAETWASGAGIDSFAAVLRGEPGVELAILLRLHPTVPWVDSGRLRVPAPELALAELPYLSSSGQPALTIGRVRREKGGRLDLVRQSPAEFRHRPELFPSGTPFGVAGVVPGTTWWSQQVLAEISDANQGAAEQRMAELLRGYHFLQVSANSEVALSFQVERGSGNTSIKLNVPTSPANTSAPYAGFATLLRAMVADTTIASWFVAQGGNVTARISFSTGAQVSRVELRRPQ